MKVDSHRHIRPAEIDFLQVLEQNKQRVYKKISEYLPYRYPTKHYKMVKDYPERQGKYLRPVLVLLANELFGGKEEDAILTAAAMQTSEDWILIHDDIQDNSEERRQKPCLHRIYGTELAINAGDALHVIMWKMLMDNCETLGLRRGKRIFDLMHEILLYTCEGQYLEISWIRSGKVDLAESEYYKMIDRKAGAYSIYGPLQLGAAVAGTTDEQLNAIKKWGIPFGRAFMIHDDVLNLKGDRGTYGKEIGGDILEGKRTLILIHLLKNCSTEEKKSILEIYSKSRKEKTEQEKDYIMQLMKKYGSIKYAHTKSLKFSERAKRLFDENTRSLKDSFAKMAIRAGMDFVVEREK
ncbi:MAG: polyprenyl synthetase family protein [Candidatus Bathyarchaeota archaeon]|jgi:geranylgeranyl diphosphate synthase type II